MKKSRPLPCVEGNEKKMFVTQDVLTSLISSINNPHKLTTDPGVTREVGEEEDSRNYTI